MAWLIRISEGEGEVGTNAKISQLHVLHHSFLVLVHVIDLIGGIWERGKEPCREVAKFGEIWRSQKSMDIGGHHGAITLLLADHMECMLCPPFTFYIFFWASLPLPLKILQCSRPTMIGALECCFAIQPFKVVDNVSAFILGIE